VYQMPHPEDLAGRWEAPDRKGGQIGINILVSTTVASSATDLVAVPQDLKSLDIGLYQRSDSDGAAPGFRFFSTSSNGGATWDGRNLKIDAKQVANLPKVHVDLLWDDAARAWTGSMERADFKNQSITLRRPAALHKSLFVGTWYESSDLMNNCVHIAQAQDGTFTGWSDDIQIPGRVRYAHGLPPSEQTMEHYGEIAKVKVTQEARIEVELRAYIAMCCSHPFTAVISPDQNSLVGEWSTGPNQLQRSVKWTRVQGDSCIAASHR
jgi:hypothetical protein